MSIKYNGKTIAGKYKAQIVTDATETNKGIIRVATDAEVNAGTDNTTAVTPKKLATKADKTELNTLSEEVTDLSGRVTANEADILTKQDKLTAGTGISIENNVVSNTQTSAEWGNIKGDITTQTDLNTALGKKQDNLTFDSTPTANSTNPVTSGGIKTALDLKANSTAVVQLSGNQTIAGTKTFSSTIVGNLQGNVTGSSGSCTGNAATATKATQDSLGNVIKDKYMPIRYSRYSVSIANSSNIYIKLASFVLPSNRGNYDVSQLFWVEALEADVTKSYALVRFGARWSQTAYNSYFFQVIEQYGGHSSKIVDNLYYCYSYTANTTDGVKGEIWLKLTNQSWVSYYLRPTQCNEYGDYSTADGNSIANTCWTYYNKSGTAAQIAETAMTEDYTQVKVTNNSTQLAIKNVLPAQTGNAKKVLTTDGTTASWQNPAGGLDLATVVCMPFGIDESENKYRYLNGQVLIQEQFPEFTKKVKSWQSTRTNLFATETNWQAEKTASKLGQCGKFVVDDTAGTIRLPLVININGLTDLANCGVVKDESLPNHSHHLNSRQAYQGGSQNYGYYNATTYNATTGDVANNSTYQDDAPVQQEAIQYPYVIVVNTGVEEAERPINNYQVNNVYAYGMSQYYKGTMNNNSWLRSAGQWNKGTVYNEVYEWAVGKLNEKVYDPSKFTVIGSPTITSDGIASGFSKNDYLNIPINLTNSSLFSIDIEVDTRSGSGSGWIYNEPKIATNLCIWTDFKDKIFSFHFGQILLKDVHLDYNSKYSLHFSRESETSFKIRIVDVISQKIEFDDIITKQITNTFNADKISIGYSSIALLMAIDLKSLSITVDGEEVFSGSKIVQADGFKKSTDSDITDYDWVINTEEQTFRLPIKNGLENTVDYANVTTLSTTNVEADSTFTCPCNGIVYGYLDTVGDGYQLAVYVNKKEILPFYTVNNYADDRNPFSYQINKGDAVWIRGNGNSHAYFAPYISDNNLYYYIGDVLENADLINIARLGEELVDIKSTPHIEEVYVNGTSGYRIWSKDSTGYRYCEQWGSGTTGNEWKTINLLKSFLTTDYVILTTTRGSYTSSSASSHAYVMSKAAVINGSTVTTNSFQIYGQSNEGVQMWKVSGYISD